MNENDPRPGARGRDGGTEAVTGEVNDYEEVNGYPLDSEQREAILCAQNECSFVWGTRDQWSVGVIMSYVWRHGKFWLTATSQRARIKAIARDPRVSIIVSSIGLEMGAGRSITAKGRVNVRTDQATKDWLYPAAAAAIFPGAPADLHERFVGLLDSERRVILEVTPEKWITFDAAKMMRASLFPET